MKTVTSKINPIASTTLGVARKIKGEVMNTMEKVKPARGKITSSNSQVQEEWMAALVHDDCQAVDDLLKTAHDKSELLNGTFCLSPLQTGQGTVRAGANEVMFSLSTSWATVFVYGSYQVAAQLLDAGIDVLQVDKDANNVIHSLIGATCVHPKDAEKFVTSLRHLKLLLSPEELSTCLMMENQNGLRPLEEAAHLAAFQIFMEIMETEGVYLTKQEKFGLQRLQYFDVTEYESGDPQLGSRHKQNPLLLIMLLDHRRCDNPDTRRLLEWKPLSTWAHYRESMALPFVIVWCIVRLAFVSGFQYCNHWLQAWVEDRLNSSSQACGEPRPDISVKSVVILTGLLSLISLIMVVYDLFDVYWWVVKIPRWPFRTPGGRKVLLVRIIFYRMMQFILAINILSISITYCVVFLLDSTTPPIWFMHMTYILALFGCVWSIFFFLQLAPYIGHYVIAVQHMIGVFGRFGLIFLAMYLPFVLSFNTVIQFRDSEDACPADFNTTLESFYGTFKVMLNMIDLGKYGAIDTVMLDFLHMIYVFIIPILMINFLVALLSNAYAEVSENRDVIMFVQRLSVIFYVEWRITRLFKCLKTYLVRHQFNVDDEGRVHVTRLIMEPAIST